MSDAAPATTDTPTSPTPTPDAAPAAPAADTSVLGGELPAADPAKEAPATTPAADPPAPATDAPVVPEKYELSLEGMTLDPTLVDAADPVFRDLGLTNEQAGKLLPLAQQVQERTTQALIQQLTDGAAAQKKEWLDAFTADPEIGGANREQTEHLAARGLDALGFTKDHPFRKALTESGFGNHPDMIRAFRAVGQMVGEDGTFARAGAGSDNRPVWERLYPNDSQR
ncbi:MULTISPECIES: hypothetical protein [unclassified Novosphingobium]|uniref:hypothetical protein n=1 Tax=unclassified Novosphingobium TaxID=2644732 RepID=UPI000D4EE682|nr:MULTISPECIES: hypothetical protein [unclassified Novosphingobium]PTR05679.1 hypothetical protein C8K11_1279 [Novosphingobium sp. GV055]PUA94247.1 hypothetical protein C8K12_1279 [Novosphingobium sp. GV061]PUB12350.1 hypothetical protein C8K14_1279 [Novosphingobium sp. GV079]PUB37264.1 hypothetical protein C8K10_1279 [Novosphingobium sp. GV027]